MISIALDPAVGDARETLNRISNFEDVLVYTGREHKYTRA